MASQPVQPKTRQNLHFSSGYRRQAAYSLTAAPFLPQIADTRPGVDGTAISPMRFGQSAFESNDLI
jgi:hypothetical protein